MSRRTPWRPASRRGPSASWSPMSNLWLPALALLGLFILDGLLAARGSDGSLPGLALAVVGAGGLIGLTEFIAENVALRDPERWANRLGLLVAVVVSLLSPFGRLLLWLSGWISGGQNGRRHPLVTEEEI